MTGLTDQNGLLEIEDKVNLTFLINNRKKRKNKTDMRSLLNLDGTLSSVLTTKTNNPESSNLCYKWWSDKDSLDLSKKATITYNNEQTEK